MGNRTKTPIINPGYANARQNVSEFFRYSFKFRTKLATCQFLIHTLNTSWLIDWLIDWLVDWFIDLLIDWLIARGATSMTWLRPIQWRTIMFQWHLRSSGDNFNFNYGTKKLNHKIPGHVNEMWRNRVVLLTLTISLTLIITLFSFTVTLFIVTTQWLRHIISILAQIP